MKRTGADGMTGSIGTDALPHPQKSGARHLIARMGERPELLLRPLFAALVFGGWEYACRKLQISQLIIPAPSDIVMALIEGFRSGQFVDGLLTTLEEIILGFALAAAAAFALDDFLRAAPRLESPSLERAPRPKRSRRC
jgi:hypothetical protein